MKKPAEVIRRAFSLLHIVSTQLVQLYFWLALNSFCFSSFDRLS
ncbi:hypothetical protein CLV45_0448 [Hymenobacter chitinivorans DSM 11115]|uniref:Uncharacterized protein n=1 Tax=Hymenobacter chitinivorans DSM 11115 TaxID=1121954 RepID=A0A2M9BM81_9BACT|nr:hypothetical protein CLV45_0448 [Hymenobacter chitinivorans DSM 11115]